MKESKRQRQHDTRIESSKLDYNDVSDSPSIAIG